MPSLNEKAIFFLFMKCFENADFNFKLDDGGADVGDAYIILRK